MGLLVGALIILAVLRGLGGSQSQVEDDPYHRR